MRISQIIKNLLHRVIIKIRYEKVFSFRKRLYDRKNDLFVDIMALPNNYHRYHVLCNYENGVTFSFLITQEGFNIEHLLLNTIQSCYESKTTP